MKARELRRAIREKMLEAARVTDSSLAGNNAKVGVSFKYGEQELNALVDISRVTLGLYTDAGSVTPVVWIVLDQEQLKSKLAEIDAMNKPKEN